MSDYKVPYNEKDQCTTGNSVRHSTLRERLNWQINESKSTINRETERIKKANEILAKLKKNPELESIVDFLQSRR